jgi:hypothetical protein
VFGWFVLTTAASNSYDCGIADEAKKYMKR